MKWITGIVVVTTVATLIYLILGPTCSPLHPHNNGVQVVAGVDRPVTAPVVRGRGMIVPTPTAAPLRQPEETTVARTDTDAFAELFNGQARDPAWAPGAEAEVRSHMPAGGDVRCAEFMCRVAMALPDRSMTVSADQQADTASRRWSADLSYNRLTATIVSDHQAPRLVFYVTRSANSGQIM